MESTVATRARIVQTTSERVREFRLAFDKPVRDEGPLPRWPEVEMQLALITEEKRELDGAVAADDRIAIADAFGDLVYVAYDAALAFGIDIDAPGVCGRMRAIPLEQLTRAVEVSAELDSPALVAAALAALVHACKVRARAYAIPLDAVIAEIHASNMTKLGRDGKPVLRDDGKVLKGPDYRPPDLAAVLDPRAPR